MVEKNCKNQEKNSVKIVDVIHCLYTIADTLTKLKKLELENMIKEGSPELIAITELKPKNFKRVLQYLDYCIKDYNFEIENL